MTTERMNFIREVRPNTVRIQLQKKIGQGLSSNVFEAVRVDSRGHTSQTVAVKITKSQEDIHALKREFETLMQVQSDHLVKVYSWDNNGDESLLSMELVEGVSLWEIFEARVLDSEMVEEIITQIQEGLKALAHKGLRHGDLSLNNALITPSGVVKLIDFANPERTRSYIHGTPPYVAPELWAGATATIESDLFALALMREDLLARCRFKAYRPPQTIEESRERCARSAKRTRTKSWLSNKPADRKFTVRKSSVSIQSELGQIVREIQCARSNTQALEPAILELESLQLKSTVWVRKNLARFIATFVGFMVVSGCWADHVNIGRELVLESKNQASLVRRPRTESNEVAQLALKAPPKAARAVETSLRETTNSALVTRVKPPSRLVDRSAEMQEPGTLKIRSHQWMHLSIGRRTLGYAPISTTGLAPGKYQLSWKTHARAGTKAIEIRSGQVTTLLDSDF